MSADATDTPRAPAPAAPFHVVGVGASAGGLEALEGMFDNVNPQSGLAFVVIQHLSPDYKSLMVELLSRHTAMEVVRAENDMRVRPNRVYLIPPKTTMTITAGRLRLTEPVVQGGLHLPIDIFFRSLADECGERAVGVVLSGTGSDGMRGVRAIKEAGGMVVVQDETQAKFDGMPRSAISTGVVDLILPVEQIGSELVSFVKALPADLLPADGVVPTDDDLLRRIMEAVRLQSNVDFTFYKPATILRRIERRMNVNGMHQLGDYVRMLEQSPRERTTLYKELLIGVTKFFRDAEAFKSLEDRVIRVLYNESVPDDCLRVWAPACSTGEEAYSLAMLFHEVGLARGVNREVKIFATDIDRESVEFAAAGLYPESIVGDVSPDRLARYFTRRKDHYQVNRNIRETVIFAYQNLVKDPPLTKMDLVVCRNMLIYLQPVLQKKAVSLLAYALKPRGFMFLGSSENVGVVGDLFTQVDSRWKIFRANAAARGSLNDILAFPAGRVYVPTGAANVARNRAEEDPVLHRVHQEFIQALGMRCLVVDGEFKLLYVYGSVSDYMQLQPGRASLDVLGMTLPELSAPLRVALTRAMKDAREVRYDGVPLRTNETGTARRVDLRVRPVSMGSDKQQLYLVFFTEADAPKPADVPPDTITADRESAERLSQLEHELQYTRENLQATIEELETSNEELQATNEELLAANEELQSTNEELQSLNEELQTVNSEYQQKIEELTQLNNDIENLLRVTEVGLIFVDSDLTIRKFTPAVTRILHVLPQDVGRPLDHIVTRPADLGLSLKARRVLLGEEPIAELVRLETGTHLLIRILPYLVDDENRGVVVHFSDVTAVKQSEERLQSVLDALPAHVALLDSSGNIALVNQAWRDFAYANGDPAGGSTGVGRNYLAACSAASASPEAAEAADGLRAVLEGRRKEFYLEYPCHSPEQQRWFLMRATPVTKPLRGVLVWHLNITERKLAEDRLSQLQRRTLPPPIGGEP